jgi:hypothetical protein
VNPAAPPPPHPPPPTGQLPRPSLPSSLLSSIRAVKGEADTSNNHATTSSIPESSVIPSRPPPPPAPPTNVAEESVENKNSIVSSTHLPLLPLKSSLPDASPLSSIFPRTVDLPTSVVRNCCPMEKFFRQYFKVSIYLNFSHNKYVIIIIL